MRLEYDNLQRIAREVRAGLKGGEFSPGMRRVRRKQRTPEKLDLLYRMAIDRLEKYPPRRDEKGRLLLPYFRNEDGKPP